MNGGSGVSIGGFRILRDGRIRKKISSKQQIQVSRLVVYEFQLIFIRVYHHPKATNIF